MQSKHIETYTTKDINHEEQRKEYGQAKRLSKSSPHLLENKMNLNIDQNSEQNTSIRSMKAIYFHKQNAIIFPHENYYAVHIC